MNAAASARSAGLVLLLVIASFTLGASPARGYLEAGELGGPGGAPFRTECPPWSALVGFEGYIGAWLISLRAICAPVMPVEQRLGESKVSGPPHGGSRGGKWYSVSCPVGYALGAWVFDMVVDSRMRPTFVNAIGLECRLFSAPHQTYRTQIGDDLGAILTKDVAIIAKMGWERPTFTQICPSGELATGVRGRSGIYIDALGLICNAPPSVQEAAVCNAYRDAAVAAAAEIRSLQCEHEGDRWSSDAGAHMLWCISLGANRTAATQAEANARSTALSACRTARASLHERAAAGAALMAPSVVVQPRTAPEAVVTQPGVVIDQASLAGAVLKQPGALVAALRADYTGTWNSRTDKNWSYEITLTQQGNRVSGVYVVENGAQGRMHGVVEDNVLTFDWDQDGGYTGTGRFVLSADGKSFAGTYHVDPDSTLTPDLHSGTWSGTRQ